MPSRLAIEGLTHRYGGMLALDRCDLTVEAGELTALLGPSGSGKSTLLKSVAGMIEPAAGRILLGDRDLVTLPPEARRLGMVFQDYALWPHLRVLANVAMPLVWRGVPRREANRRAAQALERVGLAGLERRRPTALSGGQQQRVALARALVAEPELLLLDEPLSALDPDTRASVRSELAALLGGLGITAVLVTHDRDDAFELADKVAVLLGGRVVQYGTPRMVFEQPVSAEVARFLGVSVLPARGTDRGRAEIAGQPLAVPEQAPTGPFLLAIRQGGVQVASSGALDSNVLRARLVSSRYVAGGYRLRLSLSGTSEELVVHSPEPVDGDDVRLHVPLGSMHIVPHATSVA